MTKKDWQKYRTELRRLFRHKIGVMDDYTILTHNKRYNILQEIKVCDTIIEKPKKKK